MGIEPVIDDVFLVIDYIVFDKTCRFKYNNNILNVQKTKQL